MPGFDPAQQLSARAQGADEGIIMRMAQAARDLKAKGRDVISLTVGEPDFHTPHHIREAATAAMAKGYTHYAPVAGMPELRAAGARKLQTENGLDYQPANIVIANGAKQAITNAVLALVGPGDEVIMLAPFWVSYEITVRFAGGTPVVLSAGVDEAYKVPVARIATAVTPRTKLIMLNSPCNPTGAVWTRTEMEALAQLVRGHARLMVMADEIYEYILFDGEMVSFGSLPGMLERTVTVNGLSKGFAMTGWRLGYAAAPLPVAQAMGRMQSITSAGANQFVQMAGVTALEGDRAAVADMREAYRRRRDIVLSALRAMPGVAIGPIPGTFYAFPDVSGLLGRRAGNHVMDTVEALCDWLLETHGIATVPGTAFGAENSIRLSFAASDDDLHRALTRMAGAFASLT
ncbi:MAG TPA: pyridoxal phosphate-dependent aminotransferase [Aestuariivirga sp.]|nr:pyridoxal phosphate-dependent aminotransferase [Aestuariivirga sp.]